MNRGASEMQKYFVKCCRMLADTYLNREYERMERNKNVKKV